MDSHLRRLGKFYIRTQDLYHDFDKVKKILSNVIVTRCELVFHTDSFEYVGISDQFEEIEPGIKIPIYKPSVKDDEVVFIKTDEVY